MPSFFSGEVTKGGNDLDTQGASRAILSQEVSEQAPKSSEGVSDKSDEEQTPVEIGKSS